MSTDSDCFLSYSVRDRSVAANVSSVLANEGWRSWMDTELAAGVDWAGAIAAAIKRSRVLVLLLSDSAVDSPYVYREVELAISLGKPVICMEIQEGVNRNLRRDWQYLIGALHVISAVKHWEAPLLAAMHKLLGPVEIKAQGAAAAPISPAVPIAKGYVFISYSSQDKDFIEKFKVILKRRNYGYWDYSESQRDYHNALYKELEQKIEEAAAFICILSDSWRDTEWPASEYLYAREANIPVFVLVAKPMSRPVPILLIQQTRINFSHDFDQAARVLEQELDRKNL